MESTTGTQAKLLTAPAPARRRLPLRILVWLMMAFLVALTIRQISVTLDRSHRPAGFLRGMLQGALMPAALPNLLVGNNVTIYAQNNNGLRYKLGYTCGVNACGAVFFGLFFLRLNRWRRQRSEGSTATGAPGAEKK